MVITYSRVWINRVRLPIVWYVVIQFTFYTLEIITITTTSLYISLCYYGVIYIVLSFRTSLCAAFDLTVSEAKTEIMCLRAKGMPESTAIFSVEAAG